MYCTYGVYVERTMNKKSRRGATSIESLLDPSAISIRFSQNLRAISTGLFAQSANYFILKRILSYLLFNSSSFIYCSFDSVAFAISSSFLLLLSVVCVRALSSCSGLLVRERNLRIKLREFGKKVVWFL